MHTLLASDTDDKYRTFALTFKERFLTPSRVVDPYNPFFIGCCKNILQILSCWEMVEDGMH